MTLFKTLPAVMFSLAIADPALAVSAIANVPSLWPAEGAFEDAELTPVISTKNVKPVPVISAEESTDR